MFSAGLDKQQAVTVALARSVLPNHAFHGGGVSSNSRIKVFKNDEIVSVGDGVDDMVRSSENLVSSGLVRVGAYALTMVANFPRVRGSLIDIRRPLLWVRRLACQQGRLYSKTYASFSSLLGSTSTPKEGVASASFTRITFSSHPGSLRAAMSMIYIVSSLAISAVRLWGLSVVSMSRSFRTFHDTRFGEMILVFFLYSLLFRPHV